MQTNTTTTLTIKDKGFLIKSFMQHKFFVRLLRLLFVAILLVVLYYQLFGQKELTIQLLFSEFVSHLTIQSLPYILMVLLLMPLNWYYETQKWRFLIQKIEPIPFQKALQVVLVSLTFSIFTPNRVGEYGGRLMMVSKEKRVLSIFAVMVGVVSQWITLVIGGWWALMAAFWIGLVPINLLLFIGLLWVGLLSTILMVVLYFNLQQSVLYCLRFKWAQRWTSKLQESTFQNYSIQELFKALHYSMRRYFIYSIQYLMLLYFFGFEASIGATLLGVLIVYLLQTGIPLPPSTGLIARGNIALLVFGYLSTTGSMAILASTFSLWLINVVLPAIIGGFFVAKMNLEQENEEIVEVVDKVVLTDSVVL